MKNPNLNQYKSVTLMELLIAIVLLSVVVIGFSSIDLFSRYHLLTSTKRVKLQNEVSYVLEHITKNISKAIGNESIDGANKVVDISEATDTEKARVKFYVDANNNGMREGESGNPSSSDDHWRAYRFYDNNGPSDRQYHIQYCSLCKNKNCNNCTSGWETITSRTKIDGNKITGNIRSFTPGKPVDSNDKLTDNYVNIKISACWDPDEASGDCGTPDNPTVEMNTRIKLPSVSTN